MDGGANHLSVVVGYRYDVGLHMVGLAGKIVAVRTLRDLDG